MCCPSVDTPSTKLARPCSQLGHGTLRQAERTARLTRGRWCCWQSWLGSLDQSAARIGFLRPTPLTLLMKLAAFALASFSASSQNQLERLTLGHRTARRTTSSMPRNCSWLTPPRTQCSLLPTLGIGTTGFQCGSTGLLPRGDVIQHLGIVVPLHKPGDLQEFLDRL